MTCQRCSGIPNVSRAAGARGGVLDCPAGARSRRRVRRWHAWRQVRSGACRAVSVRCGAARALLPERNLSREPLLPLFDRHVAGELGAQMCLPSRRRRPRPHSAAFALRDKLRAVCAERRAGAMTCALWRVGCEHPVVAVAVRARGGTGAGASANVRNASGSSVPAELYHAVTRVTDRP